MFKFTSESLVDYKRVTGLAVKGLCENEVIKLPHVYIQTEIPANRNQIHKPNTVQQWQYALENSSRNLAPVSE